MMLIVSNDFNKNYSVLKLCQMLLNFNLSIEKLIITTTYQLKSLQILEK